MPVTTVIQIIIAFAGQRNRPVPVARNLWASQTIHLGELPPAGSGAFALRVSKGGSTREAPLSPAESKRLTTLLGQLPTDSMTWPAMSFDGVIYEMVVMQAEQSLSFHWQNDDWRSSPQVSRHKWEHVAALADYALNLTKNKGETP